MGKRILNLATEEWVLEQILKGELGGDIDLSTYVTDEELELVKQMLGGKSIVYITEAEYEKLSESEKIDESKRYVITDKEESYVTKEEIKDIIDELPSSITSKDIDELFIEIFGE